MIKDNTEEKVTEGALLSLKEAKIIINEIIEEIESQNKEKKIFAIACANVIDNYFFKGSIPKFHQEILKKNDVILIQY
jgi:hypothetical protein